MARQDCYQLKKNNNCTPRTTNIWKNKGKSRQSCLSQWKPVTWSRRDYFILKKNERLHLRFFSTLVKKILMPWTQVFHNRSTFLVKISHFFKKNRKKDILLVSLRAPKIVFLSGIFSKKNKNPFMYVCCSFSFLQNQKRERNCEKKATITHEFFLLFFFLGGKKTYYCTLFFPNISPLKKKCFILRIDRWLFLLGFFFFQNPILRDVNKKRV